MESKNISAFLVTLGLLQFQLMSPFITALKKRFSTEQFEENTFNWKIFVINLKTREDRLACSKSVFNRAGFMVERVDAVNGQLVGINETLVFDSDLSDFMHGIDNTNTHGHIGCYYSQLSALLKAECYYRRDYDCVSYGENTLSRAGNVQTVNVYIQVRNRTPRPLTLIQLDKRGFEEFVQLLHPGERFNWHVPLGTVYRARDLPPPGIRSGKLYLENTVDILELEVDVVDCSPEIRYVNQIPNSTVPLIFEDDVLVPLDFKDKLQAAISVLPEDWDIFHAGWYCNSDRWENCKDNFGGPERFIPDSNVVRVQFHMAAMAYAVSFRGVQRLLRDVPCVFNKTTGMPCSMAIDWNMAKLITDGGFNVFGAMPPLVNMSNGGGGTNQAYGLGQPPLFTGLTRTELSLGCDKLKSDIEKVSLAEVDIWSGKAAALEHIHDIERGVFLLP